MSPAIRVAWAILPLAWAWGCSSGAAQPAEAAGAAAAPARGDLVPFVLPWDDASPGATDVRGWPVEPPAWLHRPAGKLGHVEARADGHLYAGGHRIRFLGVNLCFGACLPEKRHAERIAARMARFGVNVVRFHHMDCFRFPRGLLKRGVRHGRELDPESLDRLDYLISQLKRNGIYTNLNLLVSRRFEAADGLPAEIAQVRGKANHLVGFFHEPALELHKEYAQRLLTHRNPYTGLRYVDDPCVAFVEIINENGLVNYWFSPKRRPHLDELPGAFGRALRDRWNAWLRARYGATERLRAAWGDVEGRLEEDSVGLIGFGSFRDRPRGEQRDWIDFLRDTEWRYYRRMHAYLKGDLGCKALIVGSTCASSTPNIMATLDVIDNHVYWDNPRWQGGTWDYAGLNWTIGNDSHVNFPKPGGLLRWLAMYRVARRPYSVTEYNHSAPNVFAGEAPLVLAAIAAVQDWDAIYLFAYEHRANWDSRRIMGLNVSQHPAKMANLPIAAAMFRRGDIRPAEKAAAACMSPARELEIILSKGTAWNLANGHHCGLSGDDTVRHRIELHVGPQARRPPPRNPTHRPTDTFVSDTGEVVWDRSREGKGVLTIDTPRTKAVIGLADGRSFPLGEVTFSPERARDGGCCLSLTLLEGASLREPRRALLVATARAENTGMGWKTVADPADPNKRPRYGLTSWGRPPTVVEVVPATIAVPGPAAKVAVHALDERGRRHAEVAVRSRKGGRAVFTVGPPHRTLWYEIVWK
jgi:hypothetical protein